MSPMRLSCAYVFLELQGCATDEFQIPSISMSGVLVEGHPKIKQSIYQFVSFLLTIGFGFEVLSGQGITRGFQKFWKSDEVSEFLSLDTTGLALDCHWIATRFAIGLPTGTALDCKLPVAEASSQPRARKTAHTAPERRIAHSDERNQTRYAQQTRRDGPKASVIRRSVGKVPPPANTPRRQGTQAPPALSSLVRTALVTASCGRQRKRSSPLANIKEPPPGHSLST